MSAKRIEFRDDLVLKTTEMNWNGIRALRLLIRFTLFHFRLISFSLSVHSFKI